MRDVMMMLCKQQQTPRNGEVERVLDVIATSPITIIIIVVNSQASRQDRMKVDKCYL